MADVSVYGKLPLKGPNFTTGQDYNLFLAFPFLFQGFVINFQPDSCFIIDFFKPYLLLFSYSGT